MAHSVGARQRELQDLETIRFIASALFDVSAEKIGRLRAAFEKNTAFYTDITSLYQTIKKTARARGELPPRSPTVVRSVAIAFTSNARFYGAVNAEVMRTFTEAMRRDPKIDYIVIGKTGKAFLENDPENAKRSSYFSFEGDEPTSDEVKRLLENVMPYEQVQVYYPSFVNVFTQKVAVQDVAYAAEPETGDASPTEETDYIFEPELLKILAFFETRVRYLLFQRVMLESELARTAARLFSMNRAQDRADESIVRARQAIRRDVDTFNDMRLLESFSAISKWKK